MIVGHARTSTLDQEVGLDAQIRDLEALGCERTFQGQASSVAPRPQLDAAMNFVRAGDNFVVTKLDRLACSVTHLGTIIAVLEDGCPAYLEPRVDTSPSTGKPILNVLGGVAQFEREVMLERQREGTAKAKGEGR